MEKQVVRIDRRRHKKRDLKKKARSLVKKLILLFFILIAVFWFGRQAFNFCLFHAIRTVNAPIEELVESAEVKGIFIIKEEIVRAPGAGKLVSLVPEGARIPVGTVVARLEPDDGLDGGEKINIKSPSTGIVCYHLDGWEGAFDRASWEHSDPSVLFRNIEKGRKSENDGAQITRGDPVFKILDNLANPYVVIRFEPGYNPHIKTGELLKMSWGEEGNGKAKVASLVKKEGSYFAAMEMVQARPFPCQRLLELKMTNKMGEGMIIPKSALVKKGTQPGVYIMSLSGPVWRKVKVVATLNDKTAVHGLTPGTEVVTTPGLAKILKKEI